MADGSADLVLCTEVLEHVSETERAFGELTRVLKPGGRMIVTIPFAYPLHEEPHDYIRLTPAGLRELGGRFGLEVLELDRTGNEVEVIATVIDNIWAGMDPTGRSLFWRAIGLGSRVTINSLTLVISAIVGRFLPRRYPLNCLCVLRKPS
jgi:SAM-dependent methyltransferase